MGAASCTTNALAVQPCQAKIRTVDLSHAVLTALLLLPACLPSCFPAVPCGHLPHL
jgi:hypothetical protein